MLLYCCWAANVFGNFDDALFDRARRFSQAWADNVVIKLRDARTWMKQTGCSTEPMPTEDCMRLRDKVKSVEFAAEKMQQEVLESMTPVRDSPAEDLERVIAGVDSNLGRYLECTGIRRSGDVQKKLSIIVCAAFPDADPMHVAETLNSTARNY